MKCLELLETIGRLFGDYVDRLIHPHIDDDENSIRKQE